MDDRLKALLTNYDINGIKDYFLDVEMQYYDNDMTEIIIDLNSSIPQYDCLVESIGIENKSIATDLYADDKAMYSINTYKTDIHDLYFITKEEFGLDDGYGVTNELKFTSNITPENE